MIPTSVVLCSSACFFPPNVVLILLKDLTGVLKINLINNLCMNYFCHLLTKASVVVKLLAL